ncbi:hypothetical protein BST13_29805 [Mycobacterium aquaticum]|uniref:Uncharacterized protein n=1 Tax=Mycobacterium aquaticum TaxID=1927124 RepID=A0A1X0ACK5_9MYCO|nr:hypothetical protein BST13_29805 [Mycobacterium aquaticum]
MLAMSWKTNVSQAQAPDSVPLSVTAVANLNACANSLMAYQNCGKLQSERLAGMLNDTAKLYDDVDRQYAGKMGDPGRLSAVDAIPAPQSSTPPPTLPDAPTPPAMVSAAGYSTVEQNDQQLNSGPGIGALDSASTDYKDAANMLAKVEAPHFENWEGTAATAAMDRFKELYTWLGELSSKWTALAAAADQIKAAHNRAVDEHAPILQSYNEYLRKLQELMNDPNADPALIDLIARTLTKLQQDSNDVLEKYARSASFSPPNVSDPPFASGRTGNPSAGPGGGKEGGSKGGGGGGDSKDSKGGSPQVSPASADPNAAQQKSGSPSGGGSPAGGGAPSGGSPAGAGAGGAPSGGMPGGMPNAGKPTLPKLNEPSLKPASLGGGGGAKGGGGGGGGGGMPKMPLGPAVGSESVAPTPAAAKAGGPGAAGPAPAGAGMGGGGMGGGGMGHGGGQQGKEKRRDPNLSPDEDLYKEDRAWTEPVIGRQSPQRRKAPDGKDSGS